MKGFFYCTDCRIVVWLGYMAHSMEIVYYCPVCDKIQVFNTVDGEL